MTAQVFYTKPCNEQLFLDVRSGATNLQKQACQVHVTDVRTLRHQPSLQREGIALVGKELHTVCPSLARAR